MASQSEAPQANGNLLESYSIPDEASKLLRDGILNNPIVHLPEEATKYAEYVKFKGSKLPSIPINWRFAESVSALKGLEATLINVLLGRKYGESPQEVVIDTDHAQLFFISPLLFKIDPDRENIGVANRDAVTKYFADTDIYKSGSTPYRNVATNIYETKDKRFFHVHGSLNPNPTLAALGLPEEMSFTSYEEALGPIQKAVSELDSDALQKLMSDEYKQAGTICWTTEEFKNSEHGKANAHVGLYEICLKENAAQKPSWWPDTAQTSAKRPLVGFKVVDLTRIIAGPTITRGLAELGASIMRITAKHLPDMHLLHPDLNWGKWNASLDLRTEEGRETLRNLILDADCVVSGYRPGVLKKYGFDTDDILKLCEKRDHGIIVVRENCYGWNGPWSYRSGWQQISDANVGVSMEFGRAMGNDEPVTPVFPNSDYCTGILGACGVIDAILRRGKDGGSYQVDVALNYYSQWLVNSCSTYPQEIWDDVWTRNGRQVFRHYHNMMYTLSKFMQMIAMNGRQLFNPVYFEDRESKVLGTSIRTVKPILQFPQGKVEPGFNVGTRGNGVDQPRWPENLESEAVKASSL